MLFKYIDVDEVVGASSVRSLDNLLGQGGGAGKGQGGGEFKPLA